MFFFRDSTSLNKTDVQLNFYSKIEKKCMDALKHDINVLWST